MLESHSERLYGSTVDNNDSSSSTSEGDAETSGEESQRSYHPHYPGTLVSVHPVELAKGGTDNSRTIEEFSFHEQHEHFMQKQIRLAARHMDKRDQLPQTVSSKKRSTDERESKSTDDADISESKRVKLSSEMEAVCEKGQQILQKGPRTVTSAEKNRLRKLKKKKRLAQKSL